MKRILVCLSLLAFSVGCGSSGNSGGCKKGKPCGKSCIAVEKTCHKIQADFSDAGTDADFLNI